MDGNRNKLRKVLIVDDQLDLLDLLRKIITRSCNCEVSLASSGSSALDQVFSWKPDVVLTDIKMPKPDGIQLLQKITDFDHTITTIIMTGHGTIEMAVEAIKKGAYEFFEKPFNNNDITSAINRALERTLLLRENDSLNQQLKIDKKRNHFVGQSVPLTRTISLLSRLADTEATVLIRGESGTGKEVAARTIHDMSSRSTNELITVNCPALPEHILESELFGYNKGAFTGADTNRDGLFLKANNSTILLDEIGDIPISIQTKLLRVLQEKEIRPLGQNKTIKINTRIIASTNKNLESQIEKGTFREDLFYRLNVMSVTMPTLKQISDDIPLLAQYFLKRYKKEYDRPKLRLNTEATQWLMHNNWKGNVRELQNTINRAVLLADTDIIQESDLNISATRQNISNSKSAFVKDNSSILQTPYKDAKQSLIDNFTNSYLDQALKATKGNVSSAARLTQMNRQAFQRLMRKYHIKSTTYKTD